MDGWFLLLVDETGEILFNRMKMRLDFDMKLQKNHISYHI